MGSFIQECGKTQERQQRLRSQPLQQDTAGMQSRSWSKSSSAPSSRGYPTTASVPRAESRPSQPREHTGDCLPHERNKPPPTAGPRPSSAPAGGRGNRPPPMRAHYTNKRPASAGSTGSLRQDGRTGSTRNEFNPPSRQPSHHSVHRCQSAPTFNVAIAAPSLPRASPGSPTSQRTTSTGQPSTLRHNSSSSSMGAPAARSRGPVTKGFAAQNARRDCCFPVQRPAPYERPVGSQYGPVIPNGPTCAKACSDLQQWPTHWPSKIMSSRAGA